MFLGDDFQGNGYDGLSSINSPLTICFPNIDLAGQSFAGQYDTFLYKKTIEGLIESIKGCWASMFKTHILDYISNAAFKGSFGDADEPDRYSPENMKAPQMGVLIMYMIDAQAAGVCFSRNLWGEETEIMVEAVPGQGEGLVGGEITPDRYVVNKYTGKLVYQDISVQTHKFARSSNAEGIEKVPLPAPMQNSILSERNLKAINMAARTIEEFYNAPQDIEWAIDQDGRLNILQSRPITTLGEMGSLSFLPPGEGFWTFDPTHFPRPMTPWLQATYSFKHATYHARRIGCMIQCINIRFVHQFAFTQPDIQPPSEALERAAKAYWTKKLYEDDYREFTDFFRPECEAMQEQLRKVNPSSLSYTALKAYVARCYDNAAEFWRRHHTYTFPTMAAVGDFMNRMSALTGKPIMETLQLLEASSPESRGLLNRKDPLLAKMYDLLVSSEKAMFLLQHKDAAWALDCLMHMPGELGNVMREVKLKYGWRLAGGYDLIVPAMIETPDFFLKTLLMGTQEDPQLAEKAEIKVRALADAWKAALPEENHEEFEEILDQGVRFFRMRDERGLATDLSGIGLCRRGIMEAGRRLKDQGVLFEPQHLCCATKDEALSLLGGDLALAYQNKKAGPVELPTPTELQRRYDYIMSADPNLIPRALGTPPPPPDPMQLPPYIRRTMGAMDSALLKGIWDEGQADAEEEITNSDDKVKGVAASMGVVEGIVCTVLNDGDLTKVRKGDIVITYSCSASFNVVVGLCAGIVTDYGGMLSHAAIVAREYGVPAIVGAQQATAKFKDGDVIKIDSSTATAYVVKRKDAKNDKE